MATEAPTVTGTATVGGRADDHRTSAGERLARWIRRPSAWVEIAAWAALVVFVVVTLGPALIGHATFLNTGLLSRYTPWAETFGATAGSTNVFTSDTIDSMAPQTSLLVRLAHEGVFAAWNPYVAGGAELGGIPDSGAWSPLSLPWWFLPLSYAPGAVKLLEIVAITVGMSLLLRRWGVPRAGWAIASLVYASSGFMVAWSNWPQTRVAAVIPFLFWAIDRAAVELRKRDLLSVGGALAAMLLGGFPAIVGYALFFGGFFFLARTIVAHRAVGRVLGSTVIAVGGIVVGVLLSAWQLVPFAINAASLVDFSGRSQHGPGGLGSSPLVSSWVPDIGSVASSGAAWGSRNPVEEYSYIGIAAVVLVAAAVLVRPALPALVAPSTSIDPPRHAGTAASADPVGDARARLARRRVVGVVAIAAAVLVFGVVIVYLGGPVLSAVRELPVFDSNPIGRARCVVLFLAAALAGVGFGRLTNAEVLRDELARFRAASALRRTGRVIGVVVVLAFALFIGLQTITALRIVPTVYRHQTKVEIATVAVFGAAAALAVLLVWLFRSRVLMVVAAAAVAAMVVVPAVAATKPWWPLASTATVYPETPAIRYLERHVSDQDRYATTGSATLPGSASYWGIRSTTGHAFQTAEWKQLMRAIDPDTYPTATYLTLEPNLMPQLATSGILDRLATKYLVADPSAPLAGKADPGVAQTTWADLDADHTSVDSASDSGPLNGITFVGPSTPTTSPDGLTLTVSVIGDADGRTLASTTSWVPGLAGSRNVALRGSSIPSGTAWHVRIAVTGQSSTGQSSTGQADPVQIGTDGDGKAAITVTRPTAGSGTRVVHTGDATVYERTTALDRVHWASSADVVTSSAAAVRALADQSLPDDTVVLSSRPQHRADADGTATVALRPSDVNATVADVDATGGGWLVVADSLQRPGWTATVDGRPTDLVRADSAGGAVWVPAGKHTVRLQYAVPGITAGWTITLVTVVVAAAACTTVLLVRRRRVRRRAR